MDDENILNKTIVHEEMKAIWFPSDWHKVIVERAKKERYPIYKYLMMLSNNYEIGKDYKNNIKNNE